MTLRWLTYALIGVVVVIGGMFVAARFMDGPLGMIPGGSFRTGEPGAYPEGWSFAAANETIEMQLDDADTSRTTWVLVHDDGAYIPASLSFPPGKVWHLQADKQGAGQLRIDGLIYDIVLRRVSDPALATALVAALEAKYSNDDSDYWFFAVERRALP